ncbi:MAG: RidA family protein [Proteobacteria bacterium]|nr:RidA family protein [Pseudomonadota bacterium]
MNIIRKETSARASRIVIYNGTVYLSGLVGEDFNQGIKEQTISMLGRVEQMLEQANSDKDHILSVTIYLKDMKNFSEMNEVWDDWTNQGYAPARACLQAAAGHQDILVEISVIAAVKHQ